MGLWLWLWLASQINKKTLVTLVNIYLTLKKNYVRSSAWLEKFGTGFTEAISIHRVAGWWSVGHVVLHSIAFTACYYLEGGWEHVWWKLLPIAHGLSDP